jgi:hypothetical protein
MIVAQCQSQGFSATDLVSIVVAAGAFVVSVASLYLTSLRRPDIDVDPIRQERELQVRGYSGDMLSGASIHIRFFLANTGSTGTVLEDLWFEYQEHNTGPRIWSGFVGAPEMCLSTPVAFERDDATSSHAARMLGWNNEPPISDAAELARRLRSLQSVTVTLHWTYKRPKLFRPRKRESRRRQLSIVVDGAPFRNEIVSFWLGNVFYKELADIADPRDTAQGSGKEH